MVNVENEVSRAILDAAFAIHTELGPGLLESVYETALQYELTSRGFFVERQKGILVKYKEVILDDGFRADLIVNRCVIVEGKSQEIVPPVAYKILLTYLRCSELKLGLLINFSEEHLNDGIKRVVNRL
jgi:GxxExxY protein